MCVHRKIYSIYFEILDIIKYKKKTKTNLGLCLLSVSLIADFLTSTDLNIKKFLEMCSSLWDLICKKIKRLPFKMILEK